jgi:hypothetical protein
MDGVMPDGTNFRAAPYNIPDERNGINARMRASHRQNYLILRAAIVPSRSSSCSPDGVSLILTESTRSPD